MIQHEGLWREMFPLFSETKSQIISERFCPWLRGRSKRRHDSGTQITAAAPQSPCVALLALSCSLVLLIPQIWIPRAGCIFDAVTSAVLLWGRQKPVRLNSWNTVPVHGCIFLVVCLYLWHISLIRPSIFFNMKSLVCTWNITNYVHMKLWYGFSRTGGLQTCCLCMWL